MTLRELITKIGFTVDERGLDVYDRAIGRVYEKTDHLYKNLERAADGITKIGRNMSLYISAPLAILATTSVMAEAKLGDLQNKWGVFLGSQKKGTAQVEEFYQAARKTQFGADQIGQYADEMHRLGYSTKNIIPYFKIFSNIAAGSGQDVGTLIAYTQEMINSPASAGMLLKRMQRQHIVSAQALRSVFGVDASTAFGQRRLSQLAMAGRIDASSVMSLFQKEGGPGGRYWGKAEERTQTLTKKTQTLGESFFLLRAKIGETLDKSVNLQKWVERITNFIDKLRLILDKTNPGMKTFLVVVGGLAFAAGPALVGVGKLLHMLLGMGTALAMLKMAGFAGGAGGIVGMFKGIAAGFGSIALKAGPTLLLLSAIALLAQDIFMYMKFGDKANTVTGSLAAFLNNSNNPIVQGINNMLNTIVQFFYDRWTEVKNWWDGLWGNPWEAFEDMIPDWLKDFVFQHGKGETFGKGSYAAAGVYSPHSPAGALGANHQVYFQPGSIVLHPPAGSTATQIQAIDDHIEKHVIPRISKHLAGQFNNLQTDE
jgi:hypothetical protein